MNEHTMKLLEECCSGTKMALNSLSQVQEYVKDDKLLSVMDTYKHKHEQLKDKCIDLLAECGKCEKEPGMMASTFSYITAEMKLMMRDDNHEIAKIMMDGCNMGIQSISKCHNDYPDASKDASDVAEDLIKIEEDFMKDLKQFI